MLKIFHGGKLTRLLQSTEAGDSFQKKCLINTSLLSVVLPVKENTASEGTSFSNGRFECIKSSVDDTQHMFIALNVKVSTLCVRTVHVLSFSVKYKPRQEFVHL